MTKQEAYQAMVDGKKIRHYNYGDEEWIQMKGQIIYDEKGYVMGDKYAEFWAEYQKWPEGWEIKKEE